MNEQWARDGKVIILLKDQRKFDVHISFYKLEVISDLFLNNSSRSTFCILGGLFICSTYQSFPAGGIGQPTYLHMLAVAGFNWPIVCIDSSSRLQEDTPFVDTTSMLHTV